MAKITFIPKEGEAITLEGRSGSVMELAVAHGVPGIDGDCGGVCSCATCHVHVAAEFFSITGGPNEIEQEMLAFDDHLQENSRLSCQIQIEENLDGMKLYVAREG